METTRRQRLRRVHRRPRQPTPGRIRAERTPLLLSAAVLGPSPTRHPHKPSGHSETEQNPTAHHPPRYNPKARRKPNARSDKVPSPASPCAETTRFRTQALGATRRGHQGLRNRPRLKRRTGKIWSVPSGHLGLRSKRRIGLRRAHHRADSWPIGGARKALGFAAAYVVRCTRTGDFALTAAHFDDGGVTRLVDAQPVESWSQDRKGQVRRVDF